MNKLSFLRRLVSNQGWKKIDANNCCFEKINFSCHYCIVVVVLLIVICIQVLNLQKGEKDKTAVQLPNYEVGRSRVEQEMEQVVDKVMVSSSSVCGKSSQIPAYVCLHESSAGLENSKVDARAH